MVFGEAKSDMIISRIENKDTSIYHKMRKFILDCLCIVHNITSLTSDSFISGRGKPQFTIDYRCRSSRGKGKFLKAFQSVL